PLPHSRCLPRAITPPPPSSPPPPPLVLSRVASSLLLALIRRVSLCPRCLPPLLISHCLLLPLALVLHSTPVVSLDHARLALQHLVLVNIPLRLSRTLSSLRPRPPLLFR